MYIRHEDRLTDITVDAPEQTTFNPLISRVDLSMIDGQQSIINVFIIIIVFKPSFKCIITKNKIQINKNSPHSTSENVEKEEEILNNNKNTHARARTHIHTHRTEFRTFDQKLFTHTYTYKHKRIQTDKLDNKHYTKQGGSIIMITHR